MVELLLKDADINSAFAAKRQNFVSTINVVNTDTTKRWIQCLTLVPCPRPSTCGTAHKMIKFGCCSACYRLQRDQPTHDELMNDIIDENWLPVIGLEGLYEVSDHGRVRSVDRVIYKRYSKGKRKTVLKGRILSIIFRDNGSGVAYGVVNIGSRTRYVHRLVLEAFAGPCRVGMEARHLDGNSRNNHLLNLKWGTIEENTDDRGKHGNFTNGERNGQAKLTNSDVIAIRQSKLSNKDLAAQYGVRPSSISRVRRKLRWKHI
jgi:hypothetical protein